MTVRFVEERLAFDGEVERRLFDGLVFGGLEGNHGLPFRVRNVGAGERFETADREGIGKSRAVDAEDLDGDVPIGALLLLFGLVFHRLVFLGLAGEECYG